MFGASLVVVVVVAILDPGVVLSGLVAIVILRLIRLIVRLRRGNKPPRYRVVPALAKAIGVLVAWRGITGRLAKENSMRQPGRTMVTAAALTVGIALVAFVAVFADGLKATIDHTISRSFAGNLIVENSQGGGEEQGIPAALAPAVERVPGVDRVTPVAFTVGTDARKLEQRHDHGDRREDVRKRVPDRMEARLQCDARRPAGRWHDREQEIRKSPSPAARAGDLRAHPRQPARRAEADRRRR